MQNDRTLKQHAALVDRMAGTLGVDLEQKLMEGRMRLDAFGDAVLACTGCAHPDTCAHWLSRTARAESAPDYCRNGNFFASLMSGQPV